MDAAEPRRRRARNSLSKEEIVAAGIAIVEEDGLTALTLRRVTERIGASTMAPYRYVADREDLLAAMLDEASRGFPVVTLDAPPAERLIARVVAVHDFLAEHLWIPQLLTEGRLVAPSTFGFADACVGDLLEAGLDPERAIFAFGTCWHLLLGELLDRHPTDLGSRPTQRERALIEMDRTAYPNYGHVLDRLDPADGPPPDRFADAITLLVGGIIPG